MIALWIDEPGLQPKGKLSLQARWMGMLHTEQTQPVVPRRPVLIIFLQDLQMTDWKALKFFFFHLCGTVETFLRNKQTNKQSDLKNGKGGKGGDSYCRVLGDEELFIF